jgi:ubiquinone/menaquinone biosynthesis C-methylase UbiE
MRERERKREREREKERKREREKERKREQTYSEAKKFNFLCYVFNKIANDARNEFFNILKKKTKYSKNKTIIDIGTTPSLDDVQNVILSKIKNNKNITLLSNLDCKILLKKYPNIKKIIIGDGRNNNLPNNSFDIVHSNATIEHVGSYSNQLLFIKECIRISKKYVFIQTPNRFCPLDFHTILPFIHWLSKNIHRKILKFIGLNFYSLEKNLNLLSISDLRNFCNQLRITNYEIIKYRLFFMVSNLILVIKK